MNTCTEEASTRDYADVVILDLRTKRKLAEYGVTYPHAYLLQIIRDDGTTESLSADSVKEMLSLLGQLNSTYFTLDAMPGDEADMLTALFDLQQRERDGFDAEEFLTVFTERLNRG